MLDGTRPDKRRPGWNFEEYFWSKVQKAIGDGCWLWIGTKDRDGYGLIRKPDSRTLRRACRVLWEMLNGQPIPTGLQIRHHCDNSSCVRPEHLTVGTPKENMNDKVKRNRQLRGESAPPAVLTERQVLSIRRLYASGIWTQQELAELHGVSLSPILEKV